MVSLKYSHAEYKAARCTFCNQPLKYGSYFTHFTGSGINLGTKVFGETCMAKIGISNKRIAFDQNIIRSKAILQMEEDGIDHPTISNKQIFREQYPAIALGLDYIIEQEGKDCPMTFINSVAFQYGRNGSLSERQIECLSA